MKFEVFLAKRYMSSRKGSNLSVITWIALAGVVVGVASLVAVLAVMSGFERDLRSKILGNNAHILIQISESSAAEPNALKSVLNSVMETPGVASAMPVIYGEGFILSPSGGAEGVFIKGVDPLNVRNVLEIGKLVRVGDWERFAGRNVILGESLADQLRLTPGDSFTLVLNRGDFSPLGMTPRMQRLAVSDTFHSGMTQYDSRHAFMPIDEARALFEVNPRSIEVRTNDPRKISKVREALRNHLPTDVRVSDWLSLNQDFLSALQLEKMVMGIILGLIVLVAAFNICGSLIMVVRDKTKDIAILKSMGATDSSILKIFFMQGVFVGLVGTVVGIGLGVVMSILLRDYVRFPLDRSVYMIDTLPVDLRISDVILVGAGAVIISCLATLYPALLASRVIPTEGLKVDG